MQPPLPGGTPLGQIGQILTSTVRLADGGPRDRAILAMIAKFLRKLNVIQI